ncbi:MAG TPA: hypothetical protein VFE58_02580 [Tepidisphaeraceae bacterium]|jgi:hypothetical protein|nr:hypothetical protein [Tepidisphaeraceae bacterium]
MTAPGAEQQRLDDDRLGRARWRTWGPYLSERQWGTVREDYSPDGHAWESFPHDHARSRVYRWGEDGIAGISDDKQLLCFSVAMWNGHDPILKERLFGLTGPEGNHGEDVKELYYYLDATPTHSYLKMLYKYPQREFPYNQLVSENRARGRDQMEFELLDTGVFAEDRYFDLFVEYAKQGPTDLLIQITAHNRGPDPADLHLLPQLVCRNTWAWDNAHPKPRIAKTAPGTLCIDQAKLGRYWLYADGEPALLLTENETNVKRLYGVDRPGPFKDAFHDYVIHNNPNAVNPAQVGTKAAAHYHQTIPAGGSMTVRLRLTHEPSGLTNPFTDFEKLFQQRRAEADAFYARQQKNISDEDARRVHRQALAGLIWSKQFYRIDITRWLNGDIGQPAAPPERKKGRNRDWPHLNNSDIILMPDKWEYPWYAAWDLGFQCVAMAAIDAEFAKQQLVLITREWYMHPNGQLPAYEWEFGDVNPPVHAWAALHIYQIDKAATGKADVPFLERMYHKLMLNFTWWVNRKDRDGRNIFQGGFLGLDNIGVFDRSATLPTGGHINQADGTSWMAMYCLNLMRIALELARTNPVYQDTASKFFEHFLYIAAAMTNIGSQGIDLWDKDDEFFYDVLSLPEGRAVPLKVRSIVGLIPLFAVEVLSPELLAQVPEFAERLEWFLELRPDLAGLVSRWFEEGKGNTRLLSLLRGHRMKRLLKRMLDESEFLSPFGIRALSASHRDHPYLFSCDGMTCTVGYEPGESQSGLFGGNSNWRGPIWMPVNFLLIDSLRSFHSYYGDDFKVEYPTSSGTFITLKQVADELSTRLTRLFLRDSKNQRPIFGNDPKLQSDPHFKDHLLFPEYFHGDTGRSLGASHQTGWTSLIAILLANGTEA